MILLAWIILRVFFPFKTKKLVLEIPESNKKKDWKLYVVWITFIGTILLWATEQLTHINSNIVALIPLGVFTATGLFGKEEIKEINWNVLWLVAGGFCLGYCLQDTGLAKVLIQAIPFGSMKVWVVLVVAGLVCYLLSNFISNSATAALLIPILIVRQRHGRSRGGQQRAVPRHGWHLRDDHLHRRVRLDRHVVPDLHPAERHCVSDRHGGDEGHDPRWPDHRCHRLHPRLFLAHQTVPLCLTIRPVYEKDYRIVGGVFVCFLCFRFRSGEPETGIWL